MFDKRIYPKARAMDGFPLKPPPPAPAVPKWELNPLSAQGGLHATGLFQKIKEVVDVLDEDVGRREE